MLQHSSNNSSRSNLFALSSQSSRSDFRKSKGQKYSSFVKKVKHLLEIQGDDLDDLYRKIEIIVKKYFDEHKIVEFGDMYNHIEALKSNSSKMSKIVAILQKKLLSEQYPKQKDIEQSRKTEKNQVLTLSTRNQNEAKGKRMETELNKSQVNQISQNINQITQNQDVVVSSIKYNHIYRPSFRSKTQISASQQKNDSSQSINTKGDDTLSISYSPGKEYKQRNRQYEDQVRELMEEVKAIKKSLKDQQFNQASSLIQQSQDSMHNQPNQLSEINQQRQQIINDVNYKKKEKKDDLKEKLKIKLQQNNEQRSEIRSQQSIIDGLQTNIMKDTTQTNQSEQVQIVRKNSLAAIIELTKENIQSTRTIGSEKKISAAQIAENKLESIFKILDESHAVQEKKQVLRKKAQLITQQLRELKQVASNLQIQTPPQSGNIAESQKTEHSSTKIIFTNIQQSKHEILQKIDDTTSKQIIDHTNPVPSFIRIEENSEASRSGQFESKESMRMVQSSNFSFSGSQHNIEVTHIPMVQPPLITNSQYFNVQPRNISFMSNNSYSYASQQPQPQQLSTIRYLYNPNQNPYNFHISNTIPSNHAMLSSIQKNQSGSMNSSHRHIINSNHHIPISNNSSTTSIMYQRGIQQTPVNRSSVQKIQVIGSRNDNVKLNQPISPLYSRFAQSTVNPIYSNESINSSSSSASKRKGINILSPPPRQTYQP